MMPCRGCTRISMPQPEDQAVLPSSSSGGPAPNSPVKVLMLNAPGGSHDGN